MPMQSKKQKLSNFISRLIRKINEGKTFTIQFNGEKERVTRDEILLLQHQIGNFNNNDKSGGFLPLFGMIPKILGRIGKLFTGQGMDFPLDEEGNEKEGGFLPALGALLPMALKALPIILSGVGAASSIASTINEKRHNDKIEEIARGKGCNGRSHAEGQGQGFYLDTHQGKSIRDFMKQAIDDTADITDEAKRHLKAVIKNMKDGSFAEFKDGKLSFKFN